MKKNIILLTIPNHGDALYCDDVGDADDDDGDGVPPLIHLKKYLSKKYFCYSL
jgi:hypothetical protein